MARKPKYTKKALITKVSTWKRLTVRKNSVRVPTKADLFDYLGISRTTVHNWKNDHPELYTIIEEAFIYIEAQLEKRLFRRETVIGAIFLLKAAHGYRENEYMADEKVNITIETANKSSIQIPANVKDIKEKP